MSSSFPKDFLWGGATADFQFEGGFNEGGRIINSQDFVTSGSVKQKRQITLRLKDGSRGTVNSLESFPDGAEAKLYDDVYYPSHDSGFLSSLPGRYCFDGGNGLRYFPFFNLLV